MIAKKNPKFQEEKNRVVYFQLGLLVAGAILLMAFTWKTPVEKNNNLLPERISGVSTIQMIEEKEEVINISKVKKVIQQKTPDPVTIKVLTEFINPVKSQDKNEVVDVILDLKNGDKVGDGDFELSIGDAPKLNEIVEYPDNEAVFEGSWTGFLKSNLKYPNISREWRDEGVVFLSFVVEKDGSITQIKVKNKDRVTKELQEEAIRVIKASPNWTPGTSGGEYVRSYKNISIRFTLKSQ